jgi:AcrR family transcriptional regulator
MAVPAQEARERIVAMAAEQVGLSGLAALTVGRVAIAAKTSTALVHYHFDTKQALLLAAAQALASDREREFTAALSHGKALATLDRLWEVLNARVASGAERGRIELALAARGDAALAAPLAQHRRAEIEGIARRLPGLLRELGSRLAGPAEDVAEAVAAQLDGIALALATGRAAPDVRAAYDAFWLTVIAAGQSGPRR